MIHCVWIRRLDENYECFLVDMVEIVF
jgi:hypothetical protein